MRFIPIIFSTPMVKAILDGRKTVTRRITKLLPSDKEGYDGMYKCKYGKEGEILFVRETCYLYGRWVKDGYTKTGRQKYKFLRLNYRVIYMDDTRMATPLATKEKEGWVKRPAIFMPTNAARIFLKRTTTKLENIQDITEESAIKEGYDNSRKHIDGPPLIWFESLWYQINGRHSWYDNPKVWVIGFEQINKPNNFLNETTDN